MTRNAGWDAEVGIVGAGPAGALAAALLASRGVEVALWDPKAPWEKPCGGAMTVAAFRLVPPIAGARSLTRAIRHVEFASDHGEAVVLQLDTPLHVVSRASLGRWQLDRACTAGARFIRDPVRHVSRVPRGWSVALRSGVVQRVRHLLGADGAASLVRTAAAPDLHVALEPTRVAYVPGAGPAPDTIRIRFSRRVEGYAWDFPRPDHRSVGAAAAPHQASRSLLESQLDRFGLTGEAAGPLVRVGAVIGSALHPLRRGFPEIGGHDFALLGDAAGLADPATGEGIANALRSAQLAAESFVCDRTFASYPVRAAQTFAAEFRRARNLRRLLYGWGGAARMVEASARHSAARTLLNTLMNGTNDHTAGFVWPWMRAYGRLRLGLA
jgi:flavin-dependent dehydrogenase